MIEWNHFYPKLINYIKVYKNSNVPIKWDTDQSFADWVHQLRKSKSKLPKSVKDQLSELNFNFDFRYFEWLLFYQELKDFRQKHHHIRVPSNTSKYQSLFSWISRQRKRKEKLSKGTNKPARCFGICLEYATGAR